MLTLSDAAPLVSCGPGRPFPNSCCDVWDCVWELLRLLPLVSLSSSSIGDLDDIGTFLIVDVGDEAISSAVGDAMIKSWSDQTICTCLEFEFRPSDCQGTVRSNITLSTSSNLPVFLVGFELLYLRCKAVVDGDASRWVEGGMMYRERKPWYVGSHAVRSGQGLTGGSDIAESTIQSATFNITIDVSFTRPVHRTDMNNVIVDRYLPLL